MTERTEEDLEVSLEQDIEALKAQALENAPQALTLIDLQGKRLWANKAFCQLLGKPLEALLGVSVELAYPLEEQERVKRAIVQETIQKGGIKNFETWFQKDGKKVYVQIHTSLIRDEQGRPNAIVYSAADISAQRSRMEVLLDSLANGVCVADSSGSIHYANPSCAAFMEKPNEVLLQEGWHGLYPPEEREKVAKELARLENEEDPGEEIVSEGVYFLPDGQRRVAKRVLRPIVWEGKQRVLVNISDITELKEAQARLEEEAKYRQEVFERALNGMAVIDPVTLRHFEVNGALAEILGYSKDELLDPQFDFLKVFVPEDAPKVLNALKTALATKASIRYEVSHQRKDGGQRHVLVQISALAPRIGWESERCLVVVSDISDIKHQSDFLEGLFQISPVGLFACDIETGTLLEANPAFLAMLGYSKEEILGKTWYEITPPDVVQRELQENEALLKGEIPMIIREKVFFKKDGTEIPTILYFSKFFDPRANKEIYVDFAVDISEIKKAQEQLDKAYRYFKTIFDTSSEMFIVCGPDGKVRDVNRAAEFLFGYSKEEILDPGFDWRCCVHPEDLPFILDALETVQRDNVCRRLEVRGIKKDGSEIFLLASYTPIEAFEESSGGRLILLGIYVDITETKRLEAHLRYLSFHDSLTELFNRAYFEQELDRLSKGRRAPVGVIIVDLDNLKPVNDTLGHAEGDALLKRAARALREAFRAEDVIARLGGDEFGVILVDADKKALEGSIERLQKAIDQGKENGTTPKLSISAGYAIAEKTPFEPGELFRAADRAMYRNKITKKRGLTRGHL